MDEAEALFRLAVSHHEAGRLDEAEAGFRALLPTRPTLELLARLAAVVRDTGRPDEAEALLKQAIERSPATAGLHYNLGNLYWRTARLDAAAACYETALRLDPTAEQAALNLGNVRLAQGRFAEGWPLYEHRPERRDAVVNRLDLPEWRGEPLEGKRLLVWSEQGFGDQILAARYLDQLPAAEVTVATQPELAPLFEQLPVRVLERTPQSVFWGKDYDAWVLALSVPHRLGATVATTPTAPYLTGSALAEGGVGLAWKGRPLPDPGRSLPPELGAELMTLAGVTSLQPEDTGAPDFQATADLIAGLDLVISIDTSVAHLAGAMGKPCWVLLTHHARHDWRWLRGPGRDSFWYPSVEVIAQPRPGDWASVVAEVRRRLA